MWKRKLIILIIIESNCELILLFILILMAFSPWEYCQVLGYKNLKESQGFINIRMSLSCSWLIFWSSCFFGPTTRRAICSETTLERERERERESESQVQSRNFENLQTKSNLAYVVLRCLVQLAYFAGISGGNGVILQRTQQSLQRHTSTKQEQTLYNLNHTRNLPENKQPQSNTCKWAFEVKAVSTPNLVEPWLINNPYFMHN